MRLLQRQAGNSSEFQSLNKGRKMDELFEKIKKPIAEKLEVDEGKITMEASFRQDLGADSLDTYELIYAIEEEMGINIPDEKANEFETVKDAYEFIKSQQK
jgi:acyl carrier protein